MKDKTTYIDFIRSKGIKVPEKESIPEDKIILPDILFPHQKDIINWAISGMTRAIFASFGLGKTIIQLVIGKNVIKHTEKPFLIMIPLGVRGEFIRDARLLGYEIKYITSSEQATENIIYLTNYERVRMGSFQAETFGGVSLDEASILRNLKTQTTNLIISEFKKVTFRYVATATPTPNDFIEILNYADFLGVIDRGHALTRFFKRDSTKAGNLKLYDQHKDEFWLFVSQWAIFIDKPSDLGYDDAGYDLPELIINEHCISIKRISNSEGLFGEKVNTGLASLSKEKRNTISDRLEKVISILDDNPGDKFIIWHHLESERVEIEKALKGRNYRSVYGSQSHDLKEKNLIDFSEGEYDYLISKPSIAGSGCNFQYHCHRAIWLGIDYKFNDFIQALHRIYRYMQTYNVLVDIIYTDGEYDVMKALHRKWSQHRELQKRMIDIIKKYGLTQKNINSIMSRKIGINRRIYKGSDFEIINNDAVLETKSMPDNSVDLVVTSIPFGDHYEYSDNYHDMGHNYGNTDFFEQMSYLTPELLRVVKPGRIAAIHVKDRIRYSYQTGSGFITLEDFSGQTVKHFTEHGWWLMGKITITTDVVRENNQTYRLGWSEQCKDGTKMGAGLPEYVLIFRKQPSDLSNGYADDPVSKSKDEYTRANWQLDAHAYWRSSGDRFLGIHDLNKRSLKNIVANWKKMSLEKIYSFNGHLNTCEDLEEIGKLSATFMTLETISNNDMVWTDVNRMRTLNANQVTKKKEKHICPLQFDIVERLINRYSCKGDLVFDPFGGLMTVPYMAKKMERRSIATELNPQYWDDGLYYMKSLEYLENVPTLFDFV